MTDDKTLVERLRARRVRSLLTNRMDPDPLAIQAAARIEALEAALQEADPHNAMLPPEGANHG